LYRSGRQTDALDAYEQLRDHLREDLGLDPSDELLSLHRAVLNRDPAITLSAIDVTDHHTIGSQGKRRLSVPRQLPSDIASFTGREAHLAQLDALLDVLTRHVG
jgi:DNA-binding SARP family transcriptional activator